MDITKVSKEDGLACAQLMNALKVGRFDLSGQDLEAFVMAKRWLQALGGKMAEQLRTSPPAAALSASSTPSASGASNAPAPMRVKNMGPLGGSTSKKRKK